MTTKERVSAAQIVEVIFTHCSLYYGRDFMARWEGLDEKTVMRFWERELRSFEERPEAIRYALDNLPLRPPHVGEFREIARRAPEKQVPQIEQPPMDKDRMRAHIKKAREALGLWRRGTL